LPHFSSSHVAGCAFFFGSHFVQEPTSIESYQAAHSSGLIGQRQLEVLEFVIANALCSQGDVSRHFADASSSYQPRFRELEDSGLIEQRGTKIDPASGREVKAYVATGKIPAGPVRRKRRKIRATIEPAGDGLFRATFEPAIEITGPTSFEFCLAV
jgi:hypothetical protein